MTAYLILAASAFAAQVALFIPVVPLLLVSGTLASHGELGLVGAVVALVVGVAAGDFAWYAIGRRGGMGVLSRVCRLAIEPDTCARRTQNLFARYGARALLVAKFIPGLSTVALPLAGVFGMRVSRFLTYDALGVLAWTCAYVAAGYLFAEHLSLGAGPITRAPALMIGVAAALFCLYAVWKYIQRRRIARQLRVARLSVADLQRRVDAGNPPVIVDLRHRIDFERDPYTIPGALYIPAEDLAQRRDEIPRDREVVLYCTCPDEITSAGWALRLRELGIRQVRPLHGGFDAWRAAGLPVTFVGPSRPPTEWVLNAA